MIFSRILSYFYTFYVYFTKSECLKHDLLSEIFSEVIETLNIMRALIQS